MTENLWVQNTSSPSYHDDLLGYFLLKILPSFLLADLGRGSWTIVSVCCCSPHQKSLAIIKSEKTMSGMIIIGPVSIFWYGAIKRTATDRDFCPRTSYQVDGQK